MEQSTLAHYCPQCQGIQPSVHCAEEGYAVRRCQACGCPVERELAPEGADASASAPVRRAATILCADDDRLIRQMLGDLLASHGYTVVAAEDGPTALEQAVRERPALILLDVMMPGIDGFAVCRRLKADPTLRTIPVVLLTAMAEVGLQAKAVDVGAALVLQKAARPAEVLRTVDAVLASHASQGNHPGAKAALPPAARPSTSGPMSPGDLTIPVRRAPVTVVTADGVTRRAEMFLRLQAGAPAELETVQDRLNDAERFLTLAVSRDGPPTFLQKHQLVRVEADAATEDRRRDAVEDHGAAVRVPVRVQLSNGEQFHGTVQIEGPTGRRRLSDFLNAQPRFLRLDGAAQIHLLNTRYIAEVVPGTPPMRRWCDEEVPHGQD
jgi:CheY-like chemotaxis protein